MRNKKLTDNQERFCQEIVNIKNEGNASEALRQAYPSARTWKPQAVWGKAYRLLNSPYVQVRLKELREQAAKKHELTSDMVIGRARELALGDISARLYVDKDNNPLPVKDWPESVQRAMTGLEIVTSYGKGGDRLTKVKPKFPDVTKALDMLAKVMGLYATDKSATELNKTLAALLERVQGIQSMTDVTPSKPRLVDKSKRSVC